MKLDLFNADFLNVSNKMFHQKSNKKAYDLRENVDDTHYDFLSKKLIFTHGPQAVAVNLRSYIKTIVPSMKFSMDVQCAFFI